jgi:hypothetical protein
MFINILLKINQWDYVLDISYEFIVLRDWIFKVTMYEFNIFLICLFL